MTAKPEIADPIAIFDALCAAIDTVNGRRKGPPAPPLQNAVWYDGDGNLLTNDGSEDRYVMVEYERPLMEKTAELLCQRGGHILNVGFGCGIVDAAIQRYDIASHTIVEAHPEVLRRMTAEGWDRKPNVEIIAERWEDVDWWRYADRFDGVYFDPFPFDAPTPDGILWRECVLKVLRPITGVFVLYGPSLRRKDAERRAASFRKPIVVEATATCTVDVPFVVPEWERRGIGRHEVELFALAKRAGTGD